MKLKYKILWVEDKIDSRPFQSLKKNIKSHLESEFFDVSIDTAEDYEDFKTKFDSPDSFDLIITDLNLNESHGSQVIDFIREEKHILTEIFFYSANNEITNTRLANSSRITFHQLDGQNYHKELQKSIIGLIDLTISKFQHIVSMRGMIMHETSILDDNTLKIINEIYDVKNDSEISNSIFKEIISFHNEKYEKAIKCKDRNRIDKILNDPLAFSASQRITAISHIIDKEGLYNFVNDYKTEIIKVRNTFAHSVFDEKEQIFKTKKGEKLNSEMCKKIRGDIKKHMQNLDILSKELLKN